MKLTRPDSIGAPHADRADDRLDAAERGLEWGATLLKSRIVPLPRRRVPAVTGDGDLVTAPPRKQD
jgi:hypothetical protein